ncbi:hypothetical protein NPIL_298521 [Nephila pilipes]|uniref:Uncharacterized protein n=1 Tax=Nephila pilipes TaxID=299642 RepID=A0A8X6MR19_NEPPI|nr:hypothetical protein NPIL_298521 [Nephila pilipes]
MHGIRGDKYQRNRKEKKRAVGGGGVDSPNEKLVLIAGNAICLRPGRRPPGPATSPTTPAPDDDVRGGRGGRSVQKPLPASRRPTSGA